MIKLFYCDAAKSATVGFWSVTQHNFTTADSKRVAVTIRHKPLTTDMLNNTCLYFHFIYLH